MENHEILAKMLYNVRTPEGRGVFLNILRELSLIESFFLEIDVMVIKER